MFSLYLLLLLPQRYKFSSKSQLVGNPFRRLAGCCCYRKGTNFQANHNTLLCTLTASSVVVATAKVQIFKQITTGYGNDNNGEELLLLPQRYKFSSKSQQNVCVPLDTRCCCCYRKGTNFQANHNYRFTIKDA